MASVVPGFEHDVFVSYATVDDRPARSGWVTAFVETLRESLAATFGRRDPDRIWWDRSNIDEESHLTEQIKTKAEKSACMVVILSKGYSISNWCRAEREAFLQAIRKHKQRDARIFLVDIGNLPEADRPAEFREIRGRHFWIQPPATESPEDRRTLGSPVPDPANRDHGKFYAAVDDLAKAVSKRVKQLAEVGPGPDQQQSSITVFVAEASDTAQDRRDEVATFLADHFNVRPAADRALPGDWAEWKPAVETAIADSKVFVQILDVNPGRKIAGSDQQRLVAAQYDIARATGKPILQWRSADLLPEHANDARMKELLAVAEFRGELEAFKAEIKRFLAPAPPVKPTIPPDPMGGAVPASIFVNAGVEDIVQAEQLSQILGELNCMCLTPMVEGTPEKIREDLEANLIECDGLIMLYGNISPDWVRSQFRNLPRLLPKRLKQDPPKPLKAIAICKGEPAGRPNPGVSFPGLKTIDLSAVTGKQELAAWITALTTGGGV